MGEYMGILALSATPSKSPLQIGNPEIQNGRHHEAYAGLRLPDCCFPGAVRRLRHDGSGIRRPAHGIRSWIRNGIWNGIRHGIWQDARLWPALPHGGRVRTDGRPRHVRPWILLEGGHSSRTYTQPESNPPRYKIKE